MQTVTFGDLATALAAARAPVEPSEAHGTLCGALCTAAAYSQADWLAEVLPGQSGASRARDVLGTLYDETVQALGGQEMEFMPLLPDDEEPLAARVESLAEWCSGFLYGIGAGQVPSLDQVPGEVGEVLRDFAEIGRATPGSEDEDDNEAAYAEIVEFVRAGAQLVYEEFAAHRERVLPPGEGLQ